MRINHNIASLNTYRQLANNNNIGAKSLEKLSSGLRINRAGDDAAGLAISEKMRGQIRGLEQASKNSQDTISLIQTAEGALSETHSILQRMRELAVQSSNGTNTDADRGEIQKEINQLVQEVDRIRNTTEFNTKKLLNGDMAVSATSANAGVESVSVTNDNLTAGVYSIAAAASTDITLAINVASSTITGFDTGGDITFTAATNIEGLELGSYKLISSDIGGGNVKLELQDDTGKVVAALSSISTASTAAAILTGTGVTFSIAASAVKSAGEATISLEAKTAVAINLTNAGGSVIATLAQNITSKNGAFDIGGLKIELNSEAFASATTLATTGVFTGTVTNNAETFQIGANEGQITKMGVGDMSAAALGINSLDLTSTEGAQAAISTINGAIELVSAERSKLGANQNRLEHTINNLNTSSENLTASESRIRDVDMAKEMMEFTKMNILSQAATAMLAQANQAPQAVLQLLGR